MNIKICLVFLSVVLFSGCVATSQTNLSDLRGDVAKLQVKYNNLESKQADLYTKYEENLVSSDSMNASIQELYKKMSKISQDIKDLEVLAKRTGGGSDGSQNVILPSAMYQNAYNDFLVSKYEIAIVGFRSFINKYKDHELAPQAQYYIGESLYSQDKWADAYEQYKKIEIDYPSSQFVSSSRLKMALCLELLGKKKDSILILQSILEDYPKSAEAFTAKEKIKIYTNVESKQK